MVRLGATSMMRLLAVPPALAFARGLPAWQHALLVLLQLPPDFLFLASEYSVPQSLLACCGLAAAHYTYYHATIARA